MTNEISPSPQECAALATFLSAGGSTDDLSKLASSEEKVGEMLFHLLGTNGAKLVTSHPITPLTNCVAYNTELRQLFQDTLKVNLQSLIQNSALDIRQKYLKEQSAFGRVKDARELLISKLGEYLSCHHLPTQTARMTGCTKIKELDLRMQSLRQQHDLAISQLDEITEVAVFSHISHNLSDLNTYRFLSVEQQMAMETVWFRTTALIRKGQPVSWTELLLEWLNQHESGRSTFWCYSDLLYLPRLLPEKFHFATPVAPKSCDDHGMVLLSSFLLDETFTAVYAELDCPWPRGHVKWWLPLIKQSHQIRIDLLFFVNTLKEIIVDNSDPNKQKKDLKKEGLSLIVALTVNNQIYPEEKERIQVQAMFKAVLFYFLTVYSTHLDKWKKASLFKMFNYLFHAFQGKCDFIIADEMARLPAILMQQKERISPLLDIFTGDLFKIVPADLVQQLKSELDKFPLPTLSNPELKKFPFPYKLFVDVPELIFCFLLHLRFFYEQYKIGKIKEDANFVLNANRKLLEQTLIKANHPFLYNFLNALIDFFHLSLYLEFDHVAGQSIFNTLFKVGADQKKSLTGPATPYPKIKISSTFFDLAQKYGLMPNEIGQILRYPLQSRPQTKNAYLNLNELVEWLNEVELLTATALPKTLLIDLLQLHCLHVVVKTDLTQYKELRRQVQQEQRHFILSSKEGQEKIQQLLTNMEREGMPPLENFIDNELSIAKRNREHLKAIGQLLRFSLYPAPSFKISDIIPQSIDLKYSAEQIKLIDTLMPIPEPLNQWQMVQSWKFSPNHRTSLLFEITLIRSLVTMESYYFLVPLEIPSKTLADHPSLLVILKEWIEILCEERGQAKTETASPNYFPLKIISRSYPTPLEELNQTLALFPTLRKKWDEFKPVGVNKNQMGVQLFQFVKNMKLGLKKAVFELQGKTDATTNKFNPRLSLPAQLSVPTERILQNTKDLLDGKFTETVIHVPTLAENVPTGLDATPYVKLQLSIERPFDSGQSGLRFMLAEIEGPSKNPFTVNCHDSFQRKILENSSQFHLFIIWLMTSYRMRLSSY